MIEHDNRQLIAEGLASLITCDVEPKPKLRHRRADKREREWSNNDGNESTERVQEQSTS
jgi:hypothetical protein